MAIIQKPYSFSSNTSIKPSEVNANIDTIYNAFNGNISGANLADNAITTLKLADTTIAPNNIADNAITTAKIFDDAVTGLQIDWAGTGADSGIWWEELGRTTLSGNADSISVSNLEPRTYLRILYFPYQSGTLTSQLTFNSDSGANYSNRETTNGAADVTYTGQTSFTIIGAAASRPPLSVIDALNVTTQEKVFIEQRVELTSAGAGTAPSRKEAVGKWANTTSPIHTVTVTNASTGDFIASTELIILGHN